MKGARPQTHRWTSVKNAGLLLLWHILKGASLPVLGELTVLVFTKLL
jgi:hypothetical protein